MEKNNFSSLGSNLMKETVDSDKDIPAINNDQEEEPQMLNKSTHDDMNERGDYQAEDKTPEIYDSNDREMISGDCSSNKESLEDVRERLEELKAMFMDKINRNEHQDKIVDQMHTELQKYKGDFYAKMMRPILMDLIEIRDSILKLSETYAKKSEGEKSIPNETFALYAFDLQDVLEKYEVEIFRSQAGDDFSPIRQKAIKKAATDKQEMDGKVAQSMSCGYASGGKIMSAEKVEVYSFESSVNNEK